MKIPKLSDSEEQEAKEFRIKKCGSPRFEDFFYEFYLWVDKERYVNGRKGDTPRGT